MFAKQYNPIRGGKTGGLICLQVLCKQGGAIDQSRRYETKNGAYQRTTNSHKVMEDPVKKTIALNVLLILVVIALTATATWAYFSNTKDKTATISAATIVIDGTAGFPLAFENMLPGETLPKDITIKNGGTREADFFVQMIGNEEGYNFCYPTPVLNIKIYDLNTGAVWYDNTICDLYPGHGTSKIVKIGDNIAVGGQKDLRISLTLAATAGNEFQGKSNTDTVHLIAVQYDGPSPIPDNDGWGVSPIVMDPWPMDSTGDDDDPNYSYP
jgi:predicted ribosomally synthesized peptide with SipW-like signal peptide